MNAARVEADLRALSLMLNLLLLLNANEKVNTAIVVNLTYWWLLLRQSMFPNTGTYGNGAYGKLSWPHAMVGYIRRAINLGERI